MREYWPWMSGIYVALGAAGAGLSAWINGGNPWVHASPWHPSSRELVAVVAGLIVGLFIVASSQVAARRLVWARRLHEDLRPFVDGCSTGLVIWMAVLSGVSEELVFRSWLGGWIGLVPQAVIFALLHQTPGKSRWVWLTWTLAVGLVFGWMFQVIGSLTATVVAHVTVNALNMRFLRDVDLA